MKFVDKSQHPGGETKLEVNAEPQSLCVIAVVDKSVQLMAGGGSGITSDTVR